jgi:hypothetical protein
VYTIAFYGLTMMTFVILGTYMRFFLVSHVLTLTISASQCDDHDPRTYVSRISKHSNPDIVVIVDLSMDIQIVSTSPFHHPRDTQ